MHCSYRGHEFNGIYIVKQLGDTKSSLPRLARIVWCLNCQHEYDKNEAENKIQRDIRQRWHEERQKDKANERSLRKARNEANNTDF